MRLPRFSLLQLFLAAALCGLVLGLFLAAHRMKAYSDISSICYSKSGKFLAAKYVGGGVHVWDMTGPKPRLVGQSEGQTGFQYSTGSLEFIGDRMVIDIDFLNTDKVRCLDLEQGTWRTLATSGGFAGDSAASDHSFALLNHRNGIARADIYKLQSERPVTIIPLQGQWQFSSLAMTADGSLLVTYDGQGTFRSYDVATGKPLARIVATLGSHHADLAPDGSLVAILSGNGLMELYDPRSGKKISELPNTAWRWLEFTADGRRIAGGFRHIFEVYDTSTLERISGWHWESSSMASPQIHFGTFDQVFSNQSIALSPEGKTLACFDRGNIGLWETATGELRTTIAGGSRTLHIVLFTLGFALWAAAWGIVGKRERLSRPEPARAAAPPVSSFAPRRPAPTVVSPWWQLGKPTLGVGILIAVAYCVIHINEMPYAPLQVMAWATLWAVVILILVLALLVLYTRLMTYWYGPYYWTIVRLQAIAADQGRHHRHGNVVGWFVGISSIENKFVERCRAVTSRVSEFFGEPLKFDRLLVVGLDRQCDYDALFHMHVTAGGVTVKNSNPPIVVVCEETCIERLTSPTLQLDGALLLALTTAKCGGFLAPWVAATLSLHLIKDDDQPAVVQAAFRRMKLRLLREPHWNASAALTISTQEFAKLRLQSDEPEAFYKVQEIVDVFATVCEFLLGDDVPADRRERTFQWLRESRPGDDVAASFHQHTGQSLDELIAEWREWVAARPLAAPIAPSPGMRAAIRHVLRRRVRYRAPWTVDRERSVRALGSAGFLEGADILIGLLDPAYPARHGDLVRALESISGLPLGDDLDAWQAWWQSIQLPTRETVIEAAIVEEMVAAGRGAEGSGGAADPTTELNSQPPRPPVELKACWSMMAAGGLAALVMPIALLFHAGPLIFPTMYFAMFIGVFALGRGAARETSGLANVAIMQTASLAACDPVNFVFGVLNQHLLKTPRVRQYLHQVNGGRE